MLIKFLITLLCATVIWSSSEFLALPNENDIDWDDWESMEPSERQDLAQTCKCGSGMSRLNTTKIVGGVSSRNHAWPWMGSIVFTSGSAFDLLCGGSLINNWFLLTAAHCAARMQTVGVQNYRVILGSNQINGGPKNRVIMPIGMLKVHPKYNATNFDYDVALIRFTTPVNFTKDINPVCLSQGGEPFVGQDSIVAGWGTTSFGGNSSNVLREVHLKVITNTQCNATYKTITPQMICATARKKDSCQGDSGGPLITLKSNGTTSDVYTQIGIVSFGEGCADIGIPGVYARVSKVLNWIKTVTMSATYCSDSFGSNSTSPCTCN